MENEQVSCVPPGAAFERHYMPHELAELWGLSVDIIRNLFRDDPAVLKYGHEELLHKRGYLTLRIPESAVRRVHQKLTTTKGKPV